MVAAAIACGDIYCAAGRAGIAVVIESAELMQASSNLVLEVRELTVAIGGKTICRELDMMIRPGECWGVLGQNGVGKTTLLRTMAGLHMPQAGMVSLNGVALAEIGRAHV